MRRAVAPIILVVLLMTAQVAAAAPLQWSILGHHIVRPGETLFCIARAYGVSPWAIAQQNNIVNPNKVYAGQRLSIPDAFMTLPTGPVCPRQFPTSPVQPCSCVTHYTVARGDTLTRISARFGVSLWRIAECNRIYDLNYIRAGSVLCIPGP
ncbi:MAG: LysM peptidoglycan-binding domain-containing protein [Anaerolineae bacterium]|nr:LysM peptidoglycan-binding domain-containing protein [Anaerolineae bacterium]MCX8066884.1 LysM peptidoglycan-binding domain-containing protein [Anaerolineae bacterium]MDW7991964.1 LysM peptidoglycan-binding domain-containing protein [Anaerolineae bacterium]